MFELRSEFLYPEIKVLSIRTVSGRGNLKAFADCRIGPFIIYGIRIIQQPKQRPWVSMPAITQRDRDGQTHYFQVVTIESENLKNRISHAVLQAWEELKEDTNSGTSTTA